MIPGCTGAENPVDKRLVATPFDARSQPASPASDGRVAAVLEMPVPQTVPTGVRYASFGTATIPGLLVIQHLPDFIEHRIVGGLFLCFLLVDPVDNAFDMIAHRL